MVRLADGGTADPELKSARSK